MGLAESLNYIKKLAIKRQQYIQQSMQLEQQILPFIPLLKKPEPQQKHLEPMLYIFIFFILECVLGFVMTKVVSYILTLIANGGLTARQAAEIPLPYYREVKIIFPAGAIVAIPFSLLILLGISITNKVCNKKRRNKSEQTNQQIEKENQAILEQNEKIRHHNDDLVRQITELNRLEAELLDTLKQNVPWFPVEYCFIEAVNFISSQLQSGMADSLEQAIVLYEAQR